MRKIIVCNWLSLDGFISGPNGETDWFSWSDEIAAWYKVMQQGIDTILFGRKTFDTMAAYWPTPDSKNEDPAIIRHMNDSTKIVYSKTLAGSDWSNTIIKKSVDAGEITALKNQAGKDIILYGSGSIVSALANLQLIDRYYIMVNPILLGSGQALAAGLTRFTKLKRIHVQPFDAGGIMIQYAPENE